MDSKDCFEVYIHIVGTLIIIEKEVNRVKLNSYNDFIIYIEKLS